MGEYKRKTMLWKCKIAKTDGIQVIVGGFKLGRHASFVSEQEDWG